ncbi:hypothetical protein H9185_001180 [Listeria monocytogenes]|nr:hypothetical protein [Listeria monocytogenes]
MNENTSTEQAYKDGYEKGLEDGKRDSVKRGQWIQKDGVCWCSECLVSGSPYWKCCPVCETKMERVVKK